MNGICKDAKMAAAAHVAELIRAPVRNDMKIESAFNALAREPNGDLFVLGRRCLALQRAVIGRATGRRCPRSPLGSLSSKAAV